MIQCNHLSASGDRVLHSLHIHTHIFSAELCCSYCRINLNVDVFYEKHNAIFLCQESMQYSELFIADAFILFCSIKETLILRHDNTYLP